MNKNNLSERDVFRKFINPDVKQSGWDGFVHLREKQGWGREVMRILAA